MYFIGGFPQSKIEVSLVASLLFANLGLGSGHQALKARGTTYNSNVTNFPMRTIRLSVVPEWSVAPVRARISAQKAL